MSYFSPFPLVRMKDGSLGMNITARTQILNAYKSDENVYYEHSIIDGETPEVIADKFYDDVEMAWTILLFNDIYNVYTQWPVDSETLNQYIDDTYEVPYGVHHYVSAATGNIVSESHAAYDRVPVTNTEYEYEENDAKRKIKLILPELIGQVVSQHKALMSRNI